jgi:Ca-activated chloride channel family protein
MQGEDIYPNRLAYAKEMLKKLVKNNTHTRYAVLGFTTNAIVLSPLTQDSELLLHLFDSLDESLVITKGSDIGSALKLSRALSKSKTLSVVLLTDGADAQSYKEEAEFAKENHLIVNTMMIATDTGSTLKLKDTTLLEDEEGNIVVSRANSAIKKLSDISGGIYSREFSDIISALDTQRDESIKTEVDLVQHQELFYYFVALAILSFLVSVTSLKRAILSFLLLVGVNLDAIEYESFYKANQLYTQGKYEEALELYKGLKSENVEHKSVVFYNIANTYVRLKEFKKARENYMKSLTLKYSIEADENMRYIEDAHENKEMSTGRQKSSKKSDIAKNRDSSQKQEEGGSSNMDVSASSSSSSGGGKKVKTSKSTVDMSEGKAKLSSRQYELINKRNIDEKTPW